MTHDFATTRKNYGAYVDAIARHRARSGWIEADDLAQEMWLEIWRHWDRLRGLEKLGGVIKHRAHQTATHLWRAATRLKRLGVKVPIDDVVPVAPASQEHSYMLREVAAAVDTLDPLLAEAVSRRALGEELIAIASDHGVTRQAIDHRATKARAKLRRMGHG